MITIIGPGRCGSSLIAGILTAMGAFSGRCMSPNAANPKGYFENLRIKEIIKGHIRDRGGDPVNIDKPPRQAFPGDDPDRAQALKRAVTKALIDDGYPGYGPIVVKEPKILLIHDLWQMAFPGAQWILARRNPTQCARALNTSPAIGHKADEARWIEWVTWYYSAAFEQIPNLTAVKPERLITWDFRELLPVAAAAGITWRNSVARSFVDENLWHTREDSDNTRNRAEPDARPGAAIR